MEKKVIQPKKNQLKGRKKPSRSNRGRVFRPPPGEKDDGNSIPRRVRWIQEYLGVPDLHRLGHEIERFRSRRFRLIPLPKSQTDPGGQLKKAVEVSGPAVRSIRAGITRKISHKPSWGETGRYVSLKAKQEFPASSLRLGLKAADVKHLLPGSIHVARWEESVKRFMVIPQSGYNEEGQYAFARVTKPGLYTAIGLPRDPRLLTTLRLLSIVRPWIHGDRQVNRHFVDAICKVILCADFMRDFMGDEKLLAEIGLTPGDFTGGFGGGDICERCLSVNLPDLPEIDILEEANIPSSLIKIDFPIHLIWPRRCTRWENHGPRNISGRIGVLAVHPTNGNIVYSGTTGGGVWRTGNGGTSWSPKMFNELSLAIGGLGIAASNPNKLYAATGEWTAGIGWPVDPVVTGVGVYQTSNGGTDWDLCAPIGSRNCAAVAVDPTNPDRVFIAGERALHRSTNGGAAWDIPPGSAFGVFDGECSDVIIDPNDVNRLYLGVHRDGVYRSTDGGNTWNPLSNGIDTGAVADAPKIALGRNGTHGSQFVAVKMGDRIYTSINGGNTFTRQTDVGNPIWFTAWANVIAVDPQYENRLLAGASNLYRSTNGGSSWTQVGGYGTNVHADMQSVVFDPGNHNHVYVSNDGGVWQSTDNGVTWTFASSGLVATHLYVMSVSQTPTLRYAASVQDDDGYHYNGAPDWSSLRAGEGGYVEYDPKDHQVMYHDTWFSQLRKTTDGGTTWTNLGIDTDTNYAEPLAIGWNNSNFLLALKQSGIVSRSTNGGNSWTDVLTPGVILTAVKFSFLTDAIAYVGSNNGRIWITTNNGINWNELDTTALPNARVQSIAVDWNHPRRLYAAFAGTGIRHLWRGEVDVANNVNWFDVSGVLPAVSLPDLPLTGIALHPWWEETIFVSTMLGVLRSTDGGDSWAPFDEGLPNAFVSDLDMRRRDRSLWVSTMGRGIYRRYV